MFWFFNPDRIGELMKDDRIRRAAEALLQYANRDVLLVLLYGWMVVLAMTFTLLFTIRVALSIPLWQ